VAEELLVRLGEAQNKHPVGYLKEQPLWLVFNARHDLVSYTV
jgi:hypothetical protein